MNSTVALAGELDLYEAPALRRALDGLSGPAVVDMRDVRYVDSSALSELARCARRAGPQQITLVIASKHVRHVMRLVHFEQLFRIVDVVPPVDGSHSAA